MLWKKILLKSVVGTGVQEELDSDSDMALQPAEQLTPGHPLKEEGKVLDQEAGISTQENDQLLSEEHNYRERFRGVRSYIGWHQIPEFKALLSSAEDNPFAGHQTQPTDEISVKPPTDDCLSATKHPASVISSLGCRKI